MKAMKMLMMAALTIFSISLFAQDSTKQKTKVPKQKMEMMKYSCTMHPDVVSRKTRQMPEMRDGFNQIQKRADENESNENVHLSYAPRRNQ
ncbi:MAG: hypothetical protein V9F02_01315 [Chitinophagaceae bacterium]